MEFVTTDALKGKRPLARERVYEAYDSERKYQDAQWPQDGAPGYPNPLTIGEFVLLIEEYASEASAMWKAEKKPEGETLKIIRKIGGITTNCLEQHGVTRR